MMKYKKFSPYSHVRKSPIFLAAQKIVKTLQAAGFEAYFVGGCVRDLIISPNKIPKDIDITTSASPQNVIQLFPSSQFVGEAFGVCLVPMDIFSFEVAAFRVEGNYVDKRHPQYIKQGNFLEDSCRRDFTMNSLYYNPSENIIKDNHDGIVDISNKIIRCVGDSNQRFDEDAVRVLRALRFASDLNFKLEHNTQNALLKYSSHISQLARERILLEFQKAKNYRKFVQLISHNLNLNIFFPTSSFIRLPLKSDNYPTTSSANSSMSSPVFPSQEEATGESIISPYIFLSFLQYLSLLYKIEVTQNIFTDIAAWPLTKQDAVLCKLYLKIFVFVSFKEQKKLNKEETQFLFYMHMLSIYKICKTECRIILQNILTWISNEELIIFINLLIQKLIQNKLYIPIQEVSDDIVAIIAEKNLPNYYTQNFIDYYHYNLLIENIPESVEMFLIENLTFINKMKQIISEWKC